MTALALLAGLLAPATAVVCGALAGDHCSSMASLHACCKEARLTQCDCADGDGASHQSEPARRSTVSGPQLGVVAIGGQLHDTTLARDARVRPPAPPPFLDASDRLTLLSTLLV